MGKKEPNCRTVELKNKYIHFEISLSCVKRRLDTAEEKLVNLKM